MLASLRRAVLRLPLTIPQYVTGPGDFALAGYPSAETWDALRASPGPFALPESREAWEALARRPELARRAETVAALAQRLGARRVCSYGVGTALLELNLHQTEPSLELVCTDFAPAAVERLRALFPEAAVQRHDLRTEPPLASDLHLLHRVETEFTNSVWRSILGRFQEPVLLVADHLLNWAGLVENTRSRFSRNGSFAGFVRTDAALRTLWGRTHDAEALDVGDLPGYLLTRKSDTP